MRGDLIRILNKLLKRKDKFDHIIIETTGKPKQHVTCELALSEGCLPRLLPVHHGG